MHLCSLITQHGSIDFQLVSSIEFFHQELKSLNLKTLPKHNWKKIILDFCWMYSCTKFVMITQYSVLFVAINYWRNTTKKTDERTSRENFQIVCWLVPLAGWKLLLLQSYHFFVVIVLKVYSKINTGLRIEQITSINNKMMKKGHFIAHQD